MNNEEWVEELFYLSADEGFFNEMHDKINEVRSKHKKLSYMEAVELSYIELKRIKEENEQIRQTISGTITNNS
jgi:hypothetical protein